MSLRRQLERLSGEAKAAARILAVVPTAQKNRCLRAMAAALRRAVPAILAANRQDVAAATRAGLSPALIDRLTLTRLRVAEMRRSLAAVAALPDPVGRVLRAWRRRDGLLIKKVRVPLGVIGIIYESRPNVTSDCVGLCLKSGNAVLLRGGSEALRSNVAIARTLRRAARRAGLPAGVLAVVPSTDRRAIDIMTTLSGHLDLIIPRGGEALIRRVAAHATVPVIKHYKGVCHVYVDDRANLAMAEAVAFNAKVQRPATCNAMETLLVHRAAAARFLPSMIRRLKAARVEVRGCPQTRRIVPGLAAATERDWSMEYLDLILSVKVVPSLQAAIDHINRYGTSHSDTIVTDDRRHAEQFLQAVDSAAVYVNASTRLTDGFQFGLGAEMGISTDKLHARGPMGLEELTTYKYQVYGRGHLRT
ncbi:MAG: glutamate-5-semialdehyde dehydrogenase [Candidatus Omnitrophica bacterium]|nr:glutamate-5-semialdehyde dehydrogenase [Candidatus Omnitrophota bacterium]